MGTSLQKQFARQETAQPNQRIASPKPSRPPIIAQSPWQVGRTLSWPYYAASAVFFAAIAVNSAGRLPFLLLFSAASILQLFYTVFVFF
jgi:hypothetical protein